MLEYLKKKKFDKRLKDLKKDIKIKKLSYTEQAYFLTQ